MTCFCSYATMIRIPRRFPTTIAIVSGLTRVRRSSAFNLTNRSIYSIAARYSSVSGLYVFISVKSFSIGSSRIEIGSAKNRLNIYPFCCLIIIIVYSARSSFEILNETTSLSTSSFGSVSSSRLNTFLPSGIIVMTNSPLCVFL